MSPSSPVRPHLSVVPSAHPIRVVLIDPFEVALLGLRSVLAPFSSRVELVGVEDAVADPRSVDVVLYEPVNQTSATQGLLRHLITNGGCRAAVYSWRDRAEGASTGSFAAHLSKALAIDELVAALESLHAGGSAVAARPAVDRGPLRAVRAHCPTTTLTAREAEVLFLVTQGLTNNEISGRLCLSINSVKTYIRTAYRSIEVTRRSQAVAWGMQHGLAPLSGDPMLTA